MQMTVSSIVDIPASAAHQPNRMEARAFAVKAPTDALGSPKTAGLCSPSFCGKGRSRLPSRVCRRCARL